MMQVQLKGETKAADDRQVWFCLEESSGIYRGTIARVEGTRVAFRDLFYTGDNGQSWSPIEFTPRNADWAAETLTTQIKYFDNMGSAQNYRTTLTPKAANLW